MRKAALALSALALAAACGGGASGGAGGGVDRAAASAESSAAASAPASVAAAGASTGPALRDVATRSSAAPFKVTYRFSTNAGGQAVDVTQTWYQSGARFRMDLATPQSAGGSFSFFVLPEGTYTCGIFGGAGAQCTSLPGGAGAGTQSPAFQLDSDIRANAERYGASFAGTRQVAGLTGQCFSFGQTAGASFQKGTACYSSAGIPLFMQFDAAGGSFTMEATAVGTPTDADFRLPATPR